ncbi:hypothetical protein FIBSPDRAFT_1054731 [Athelia psychrophila]|uniref:CxC2-like cysteine cluster KDZ transposase-associated domain-containing protein n=1 Tax=Athelia psychrophila TaxID=1759441 RepID=A0A167UVY9_9AGAM|nr:hypothetical protein FIBSPDRAFT_1054731 [Fibularhizoctonia sp. CBS 109695]
MSEAELANLAMQAAISSTSIIQPDDIDMGDYSDVVNGHQPVSISHTGGEMGAMAAAVVPSKRRRVDRRKHRDRNRLRQQGFDYQIEALTNAYTSYLYNRDHGINRKAFELDDSSYDICVVDTLVTTTLNVSYKWASSLSPCPAIVMQGVIPTAPQTPTIGFRIETMELYCTARFRCPQLSVQAWVHIMADLQGDVYARYRSRQFSIAYDLYLAIRANAQSRVSKALDRKDPDWCIRHVCPPCMNKLQDELEMKFSMLWAMDGNDSLKRFERRAAPEEDGPLLGASVESIDTRTVPGNVYLSRPYIDKWAMKPGDRNHDPEEDNPGPCREHWKNMKPEATARSWGCFRETGVFTAFCRHGFCLTITNMYCMGEQSKYGLATSERMMLALGPNQGAGLDIGCSHRITLAISPLGPLAKELNHTILVDAFHGHAHNRLCQLSNLTTYVEGLGLEALSVCEQAFSKSNALAGSTRSMGTFHQRQAIAVYFRDMDDFEHYYTMTTYIHTMYKKALDILEKNPDALEISKAALGITGTSLFEGWRLEETEYLQGLQKEPPQETLRMEYYQRLNHLSHCDALVNAVRNVGFHITDPTLRDTTNIIETRCQHAIENHQTAAMHVHDLELRMGIQIWWAADSVEYAETGQMVTMRSYQHAMDVLEGLVVARLFNLASMNRAGMGYKQRKHIGKALQARSAAIKATLGRYNAAALALNLPRDTLNIEQGHTSRCARVTMVHNTMGRITMDQYFKLKCAPEEITRCNIEITRIVTHLRDEEAFLQHHEERLRPTNPVLAYQMAIHCNVRGRFTAHHNQHLALIAELPGFSGSLEPGISLDIGPGGSASWHPPAATNATSTAPVITVNQSAEEVELEGEQNDDEDEAQEHEDEADLLAVMFDKVDIARDSERGVDFFKSQSGSLHLYYVLL